MVHQDIVDPALLAELVKVEAAKLGLPAFIEFTEAGAPRRRVVHVPAAVERVFVAGESGDDVAHLAFGPARSEQWREYRHVLGAVDTGLQRRVLGGERGGEEEQGCGDARAVHLCPQGGNGWTNSGFVLVVGPVLDRDGGGRMADFG